jgi:hypothetical protein
VPLILSDIYSLFYHSPTYDFRKHQSLVQYVLTASGTASHAEW